MEISKQQLPLDPRRFRLPSSPGEKAHLIGTRCSDCKVTLYPKQTYCLNCTSTNVTEVRLGTTGWIHSFTILHASPPGSLIKAPYALAQVRLPEDVLVTAVLTECDFNILHIDMKAEMVIEKIKEDEEGNDVMTFKFRPVT